MFLKSDGENKVWWWLYNHFDTLIYLLPVSFRQPCMNESPDDATFSNSSSTCSPLSPSIMHPPFHSRLKTHPFHTNLFHQSANLTGLILLNGFHFSLFLISVFILGLYGRLNRQTASFQVHVNRASLSSSSSKSPPVGQQTDRQNNNNITV